MKSLTIFFLLGFILSGCSLIQKTAKQNLSNGFYIKKTSQEKSTVYVEIVDEKICIYSTQKNNQKEIDTMKACSIYFPELNIKEKIDFTLTKTSFDIDFLTIPLKLRFAQKEVPPQLNTNLNGAVYLGFRTDNYKINYQMNPLKKAIRTTNHFGYSIGFFSGFGNTFMSPTNTNNLLQQEYDGIIWSKGVASIIGINNFTIGIALGFDNLLDKNNRIWIYENKPWFGLAFGLNLN